MQRLDYMDTIADSFLDDIFVTCREKQYAEEINEKISSLHEIVEQSITPHLLNLSMYKLHISMSYDSYLANFENILDILIKYIDPTQHACIKEFKFLHTNSALKKIKQKEELIGCLYKYKNYLNGESGKFDFKEFKSKLAIVLKKPEKLVKGRDYPKRQNIEERIKELEFCIATQRRFLHGDQFTIYLLKDFSPEKVLHLCKEINNFLTFQGASEGFHSDVVGRIGRYISLRKEYSTFDYEEMEKAGVVVSDKRIDAIQEIFTEEENVRRVAIRDEIINSDLYSYLSHSAILKYRSLRFYQPAQQLIIETKQSESLISASYVAS